MDVEAPTEFIHVVARFLGGLWSAGSPVVGLHISVMLAIAGVL